MTPTTFMKCIRRRILYSIPTPIAGGNHHYTTRHFSSCNHLHLHPPKPSRSRKRLRVIDIVTPTATLNHGGGGRRQSHLRLIEDILQTETNQPPQEVQIKTGNSPYSEDDPVSALFKLNSHGFRADPGALSQALTSCVAKRDFTVGIQIHGLAITTGFLANVYVGSSLISLYCKCGGLNNAYQLFDEMPVRNVVSWTTMITGFSQDWQVDSCFGLYHQMRNSATKPNEFTLTSLLSACTASGSLGHGRTAHCQAMQMGFVSFTHLCNALISMYSKCGELKEALRVFKGLRIRDIFSWNSMIAGYSQHGLALQAINLYEEMKAKGVKPDGITFLGVLSSCRHVGLVKQGQFYFKSMIELGLVPEIDHYSCIVDLLGRSGDIEGSRDFIKKMPLNPNAIIWGSLLSSCRHHGNVWIGIEAAENRLVLEPGCAATYLQLINLNAAVFRWDQVARLRKMMKDRGLVTNPGYSWIEIGNTSHRFGAQDSSVSRAYEINLIVDILVDHMSDLVYEPEMYQLEFGILENL